MTYSKSEFAVPQLHGSRMLQNLHVQVTVDRLEATVVTTFSYSSYNVKVQASKHATGYLQVTVLDHPFQHKVTAEY